MNKNGSLWKKNCYRSIQFVHYIARKTSIGVWYSIHKVVKAPGGIGIDTHLIFGLIHGSDIQIMFW